MAEYLLPVDLFIQFVADEPCRALESLPVSEEGELLEEPPVTIEADGSLVYE